MLNRWKKITKRNQPPEGQVVWFYEPAQEGRAERIWTGEYEYCADDPGGWFYGNNHGNHHWNQFYGRFESIENEWDDDYKPTHWMPLPEPPTA